MNSTGFSAPFRSGYRASGVLLHVTSLPSRYGIGDVGPSAFAWVDQLAAAGQGWWQVLPLGHDNDTTRGWYDTSAGPERRNLWNYLHHASGESHEAAWELIRLAWSSGAALAVTPLQDLLGLGSASRMNVPGCADGQWRWRCPADALNDTVWQRLQELTRTTGRLAGTPTESKARYEFTS